MFDLVEPVVIRFMIEHNFKMEMYSTTPGIDGYFLDNWPNAVFTTVTWYYRIEMTHSYSLFNLK